MKALSVRQPYAWLIVAGHKPIENRTWRTRYRGPLVIHAASRPHKHAIPEIERRQSVTIDRDALRYGGLIGRVTLADVVESSPSPWFEGPIGFVLIEPVEIVFVPYSGRQTLFDVPDGLVRDIV